MTTLSPPPAQHLGSADLNALLGLDASGRPQRRGTRGRRWLVLGLALALVAGVGLVLRPFGPAGPPPAPFVSEPVVRGTLQATVIASGTLQPTQSVEVGSELSGTLEAVLVEENDRVSKGQVIARLDTSKLMDQVAKSRAALEVAQAAVLQAQATVAESRANLARLRLAHRLSGGQTPSAAELETAEAMARRALAAEASARASVTQSEAALKTDLTNVDKATIRSPVDGVVLSRKVEPGQTVVAAMSTPVLFSIAEDLTRMELQVKVDEADVAAVAAGQPASFSVFAWPGRKFPARIKRVGLGATTSDNVVTYKTILTVTNDDLALRPGMTATAEIVTAHRDNVLLVPNAALRFTPPNRPGPPGGGGFLERLLPHPPPPPASRQVQAGDGKRVWLLQDGRPQAVAVTTGVTNGRLTEVSGEGLSEGALVITESLEPGP